jgi:V8-like Glu-specific endopeptidase
VTFEVRPTARRGKLQLVLWVLSLAIGGVAADHASAQPGEKQGATTTLRRESVAAQAARDSGKFKTREGRLQAKPLDWNATIGKPTPPEKAIEEQRAQPKEPGYSEGGRPDPNATKDAQKLHPEEWRRMQEGAPEKPTSLRWDGPAGEIMLAAGSPDVFTQYCENCPSVNVNAPAAAIGRLFSNAGTCSASVVSGNDVIVTAAHCCYDRSKRDWIGGWTFAPAYDNGNAPFGMFDWSTATILTSWIDNGDVASDVCLIKLQRDSAGRGVTYYTGWLGRSWDWGSAQELHALGYPGNLGSGQTLQLCTAESFSPANSCGGGDVLNMGCSMTYGSSGGPWVRSYRGGNWVNAVVHGYDSQSCTGTFGQTFNGPRFTSGNIVTLCNAAGC